MERTFEVTVLPGSRLPPAIVTSSSRALDLFRPPKGPVGRPESSVVRKSQPVTGAQHCPWPR